MTTKTEGANAGEQKGAEAKGGEKTEPETVSMKDFKELQTKFQETERARIQAEEKLAYAERDKEKLSGAKEERDKLVKKGAESGDKDAQARAEQLIRDEMQGKIDDVTKERDSLKAQLHQVMVIDRGLSAVAPKFRKDVHDIVRKLVAENLAWEGDPETGALIVKDAKGQARFKEGTNQRMSVEDWAEEIGKKHPSLLDAEVVSGGKDGGHKSTPAPSGKGGTPPPESASWGQQQWTSWMSSLSQEDRNAFMKSRGMI